MSEIDDHAGSHPAAEQRIGSTVTAPPRVLYIGGIGRSGSTLLERLLGQIDGVQTLGETVHLWLRGVKRNEKCGCGQPFHECPFWRQVGETAFGGWSVEQADEMVRLRGEVDRMRRIPWILAKPGPDVERYADAFRAIYAAVRETSGATVIVDSSKHSSLAYCLRTQNLDFRALHVVRDPRAVAYSWSKTVERPEATDDEKFMNRYTPRRAASLWDAENAAMSTLRLTRTPVMRLRYEDLVADPPRAMRGVMDFAGLGADVPLPVDGHTAVLGLNHTVSGNPVRMSSGPVTIARDDAWLTKFAPADRKVVSAMTAPLRLLYRTEGARYDR
jgi:hypothetical protein